MTCSKSTQRTIGELLFAQGFGTRRECAGLVISGQVSLGGQSGRVLDDPFEPFEPDGLHLIVQGQPWPCREQALILLNKPAGFECSQKPKHWPSVLMLVPPPLRRRGVQPVGRLDQDTTGLLLLTDDGALIHRLTSPRHHVPKVYEVDCARDVDDRQMQRLLDGVVLDDDPAPVRAEGCEQTGDRALRLTLVQGKYHQVKRMVAAVGNHCAGLHRSRFGALVIPEDVAPGQWCWVDGLAAIMGEGPDRVAGQATSP